ncbi:MAG: signal peptide peptidase SppA [Candidatus Eisenbacteria sp.]|nr:signal peptide peptidase SppA [Candidatus Eisenbacteria bacterium]
MKGFWNAFFGTLVAVVVLVFVISGVVYWKINEQSKIEKHSYLVIDLYGSILEYTPPGDIMSKVMGGEAETLQRILDNLEKASVDDRIEGVIVKMSSNVHAGGAMLGEMRGAIRKVREAGKKVYGFADSMNRSTVYLAAACDSVFAPRDAYIDFRGFGATTTHVRGTLDKLGIKPNLHKIKDYKSAAEVILREDLSPEAKENLGWVLDEVWENMMSVLREDRGLNEDDVLALMRHAAFTSEEAREGGLIDEVLYWDELENRLMREDDDELRTVSQGRYADEAREDLDLKGKKTIAVVHAQGLIAGRQNKIDPLFGIMMGHETIVRELRRTLEDEDVAAIVFRVDSGGGDALTSDLIGHQVEVTSHEKPVVVSMVDVAASGGYHIAYRASKIVADPMTLTGSIGSISGKLNIRGFHDKLGITHDCVTRGPMALMWSSYQDFTDEERKRFEQNHWDGFNTWLADIADHRGMTFEEAEKLAHGRVWMGTQAKANGLVDELGGLDKAIEVAKQLAEIPEDEKVTIVHYPEEQGFVETVLGGGGDMTAAVRYLIYRFIRDDLAETWHMIGQRNMYMMEPVDIW